jgi:hypothetical protein
MDTTMQEYPDSSLPPYLKRRDCFFDQISIGRGEKDDSENI